MNEFSGEVKAAFSEYRAAHPDPGMGADFMPRLWERIEGRKSAAKIFRRMTQMFVSLSAATALLLGAFLIPNAELPGGHYADVVADADAEEQVVAAAAPVPAPTVATDDFQQ